MLLWLPRAVSVMTISKSRYLTQCTQQYSQLNITRYLEGYLTDSLGYSLSPLPVCLGYLEDISIPSRLISH